MDDSAMESILPGTTVPRVRNLDDLSKVSSMDMMALNNLIVSLRVPVRKARVCVINKLIRSMKRLKTKKGTDDQVKKNLRKVDRYHEEIKAIRSLDIHKIAKFALANTSTFDEVTKKPDSSMTARALSRLSSARELSQRVEKWRSEHDDWRELAGFILYKNTGRRYRKNRTKRKAGESVIREMVVRNLTKGSVMKEDKDISSDVEDDKMADDVDDAADDDDVDDAADDGDGDGDEDDGDGDSDCDNWDESESDKNSDEDGFLQKDDRCLRGSRDSCSSEEFNFNDSADDLGSDDSEPPPPPDGVTDQLKARLLGRGRLDIDENSIRDSPDKNQTSEKKSEKKGRKQKTKQRLVSKCSNDKKAGNQKGDEEYECKTVERGDMVVKKMSSDSALELDESPAAVSAELTGVHRPKSSFFLSEEGDGDDPDGAGGGEVPQGNTNDDFDFEETRDRDELSAEQAELGRRKMDSIFISNLSRPKDSSNVNSDARRGTGYRGRGSDFRGRGSAFGRGTDYRGRGTDYRGRGSDFSGRGSVFGRGTDYRGRGSAFGRGTDYRGRGSDSRGLGSAFGRGTDYRGRGTDSRGRGSAFGRGTDYRGRGTDSRGRGSAFGRGTDYRGRGSAFGRGSDFDRRGRGRGMNEAFGRSTGFSDGAESRNNARQNTRALPNHQRKITDSLKSKTLASSEDLHPSWEASRKRKEQSTIQAFAGKKIKFDD